MSRLVLVSLLIGSAVPLALRASDGQAKSVECLKVEAQPWVHKEPAPGERGILHVVLTNECDADVTAFALDVQVGSDPDQVVSVVIDLVPRLAPGLPPEDGILLVGAEFPWDVPLPGVAGPEVRGAVRVGAVVFADRTAVGDAHCIANIAQRRRLVHKDFLQKFEFLQKIEEFDDAKAFFSQPPDASLSPTMQAYWRETKGNLGANRSAWTSYILGRKADVRNHIDVFQLHSNLEAGVAQ